MSNPVVYVIILNWNSYNDTITCINSVQKNVYTNYKIVIVDNGSTNDSVSIIKRRFPNITLLESKKNLGFSGGNNIGIKFAIEKKADYVLILNNDTIVDKGFLVELLKTAASENNVGIVSPVIYYMDKPEETNSCGGKVDWNIGYPFIRYDKPKSSETYRVDFVSGCCQLIPAFVLKDTGLYDEDYFMYMEDYDFCYKVQDAGYSIYVNPKAKIWHAVSKNTGGEGNAFGTFYVNRNKYIYITKHHKGNWIYYLKVFRSSLYEFKQNITRRQFNKSKAVFFGTIQGICMAVRY